MTAARHWLQGPATLQRPDKAPLPTTTDGGTLQQTGQTVYNSTYHTAIKCSPTKALKGYDPVLPGDLPPSSSTTAPEVPTAIQRVADLVRMRQRIADHLETAREYYRKHYNRYRMDFSFNEGDWVLLSSKHLDLAQPSHKLAPKYHGPFKIIKRIGRNGTAYRLDLPTQLRSHNVFHVSSLEPYSAKSSADLVPADVSRLLGWMP